MAKSLYLSVPVDSDTGNHIHTPLSPSYITTSHLCTPPPFKKIFFFTSFTPLSFWSTFPFHPSSSSFSPERLICDWACCVFYRRLAAAWGQRAAEMPQCLYILPVRRCERMKRDWHSIICARKLEYSWGWMDGWRLTRGMRTKERRRMGARVVIDYAKSQAKRETRQRITRGQTETTVESLSFICFSLCFSTKKSFS